MTYSLRKGKKSKSGRRLGADSIKRTKGGRFRSYSERLRVASSVKPGTYYLTACVRRGSGTLKAECARKQLKVTAKPAGPPPPVDTRNTSRKLRDAITADGMLNHLKALQAIADEHGGTRASGFQGYGASVQYVLTQLRAAGYNPTTQVFDFVTFEELAPPVLKEVSPTAKTYAHTDQVATNEVTTMNYSASGDTGTKTIQPVDVNLNPTPAQRTSTSGCEDADFATFTSGNIALHERDVAGGERGEVGVLAARGGRALGRGRVEVDVDGLYRLRARVARGRVVHRRDLVRRDLVRVGVRLRGRRHLLEDGGRELLERHEVEDLRRRVVARGAQLGQDVLDAGAVALEARGAGAAVLVGDGLERLEVVEHPVGRDRVTELAGGVARVDGRRRAGGLRGHLQLLAGALGLERAAAAADAGGQVVRARLDRGGDAQALGVGAEPAALRALDAVGAEAAAGLGRSCPCAASRSPARSGRGGPCGSGRGRRPRRCCRPRRSSWRPSG